LSLSSRSTADAAAGREDERPQLKGPPIGERFGHEIAEPARLNLRISRWLGPTESLARK